MSETGSQTSAASTSRLVSASALMAAGTMVSRVLGFVRVALLAYVLGNGTRQADMYGIATTIPNSLYILFAGGALNTVLVPQLIRSVKNDPDGGEAYTNRVMTAFLLIVGGVTALLTLAAPWVIRLYSSDRWRTPEMAEHYQAMVLLGYLCLPEVFFFGVFFLFGQVLNAREKFGPMMWAPIANNVIAVVVLGVYLGIWGRSDGGAPFTLAQTLTLGGGATLGIVAQTAVMVFFLRSVQFKFRPRFDLRGTGLGHTFHLAKWTLGFVLVNQLALIVVDKLATSATVGGSGAGLTVYNNAYLIWILPHSLITISLATAMLPSASRLAAEGDLAGVRGETMRTIRLATSVLLPAAAAFIALSGPLAHLLFGHGSGAEDARFVGWTLIAFAIGLVPFTIQYICLRSFYALEDTRSTFLQQLLIAGTNVVLAVLFVVPLNRPELVAPGLALAYSVSYLVGVIGSFRRLGRSLPDLSSTEVFAHLGRVGLAVAPAAVAAYLITDRAERASSSVLVRVGALAVAGVIALVMFFALARLLKIEELNAITGIVLRRRQKGGKAASSENAEGDVPDGQGEAQTGSADGQVTKPLSAQTRPSADDVANDDAPTDPGIGRVSPAAGASSALTVPLPAGGVPPTGSEAAAAGRGPGLTNDEGDEETLLRTQNFVPPADSDPTVVHQTTASGAPGDAVPLEDNEDTAEEHHPIQVHKGQLLGDRYRLDEVLVRRQTTQTWRAFDSVLSRSVLVHLLTPGDDRNRDVLDAARKAAVATDSRFLRVLDAAEPVTPAGAENPLVPYIVCEYAPGQSLESLLIAGPLSGLEAAWLIREVAEALTGMHAQGLYHQRISPDTVVVTAAGNVKIVGFLLEAVLDTSALDAYAPQETPEVRDVLDLGRLLYCTLVSRWPGRHGYGMLQAPTDPEGRLLTPRQVRAGVQPALDRICDQILSETPRQRERPLRTAVEVATALNKVLGTADASHDLERRIRYPVPVVQLDDEEPPVPTASAADPDAPTGALMPVPSSPDTQPTPGDPMQRTPIRVQQQHPRRRRWLSLLVGAVLLIMVCSLIAVGLTQSPGQRGQANRPKSTQSAGPVDRKIVSVSDFDPEGGDRHENEAQAKLAADGNPSTAWTTVVYRNARMDKRGVGLVFDLGSVVDVSRIEVRMLSDGGNVEWRIPANNPDKATSAPMNAVDQWRRVANLDNAPAATEMSLNQPVKTRFILILLTQLPPAGGGGYQGGIGELSVRG